MADFEKIGEIIESSSINFTAQSYELYKTPPLGSLVKARWDTDRWLYGIVYNTVTTGIEPGRKPVARGRDAEDEEDIYRSNPQLAKLLKSEFNVLVVGHKQSDRIYQYLPPKPARIHGLVYQCEPDEVKEFSRSFDFLNILLKARVDIPVEEMVAAALRMISHVYGDEKHAFLVSAGKELAVLLSRDYAQLKVILKGLKYDAV